MMKFEIYILQKKSQDPKMYQEAMGEYLKRLGAYAKVSVISVSYTHLTLPTKA